MGAKPSRKKSEGGTGAEKTGPADDSLVAQNKEQKPSEDEVSESASEKTKPVEKPSSSSSFLETITQAVEDTVNTVTEQIAAPVEDVVNKGIKAVESVFAGVNLNTKEPAAPEQEPEQFQESRPEPLVDVSASGPAPLMSESTLLGDLLKPQSISEALIPEVREENKTITSQMADDVIYNPASAENKDLLGCLDKMVTLSADLLDCKLTPESTIPNSDPSLTLGDADLM